jgi:hypothetical protein
MSPSGRIRYRMTVEVDTPDGVKSGSSVIESVITKGPRTGEASGISYAVKGEAVAVDLGNGQLLFALLSGRDMAPADFQANLFHDALERGAIATPPLPRKYRADEWREEREVARSIKPVVALQPADYPKLVRFGDLADPKTIGAIDPSALSAAFGQGVSLKRISIAVTDDEFKPSIKRVLSWLGDYPEPSLNSHHNQNDFSLSATTHHGDFIRGATK